MVRANAKLGASEGLRADLDAENAALLAERIALLNHDDTGRSSLEPITAVRAGSEAVLGSKPNAARQAPRAAMVTGAPPEGKGAPGLCGQSCIISSS